MELSGSFASPVELVEAMGAVSNVVVTGSASDLTTFASRDSRNLRDSHLHVQVQIALMAIMQD
jgi:hypothetical protein